MEGLTKDSLMVRGRFIDRDKGKFFDGNSNSRVYLNPQFSRQEDAGNVVKLGITKGTAN
jgi:hypothetical protein